MDPRKAKPARAKVPLTAGWPTVKALTPNRPEYPKPSKLPEPEHAQPVERLEGLGTSRLLQ